MQFCLFFLYRPIGSSCVKFRSLFFNLSLHYGFNLLSKLWLIKCLINHSLHSHSSFNVLIHYVCVKHSSVVLYPFRKSFSFLYMMVYCMKHASTNAYSHLLFKAKSSWNWLYINLSCIEYFYSPYFVHS